MIKFDGIYIWINSSYGDTLLTIALLKKITDKYPDVSIFLGCWKSHAYLAEHLPVNLICFKPPKPGTNYFFNRYQPSGFLTYNSQVGLRPPHFSSKMHWKNMIFDWNKTVNFIRLTIDYKELEIDLPFVDVDVCENSIFVENGPAYSGHNDFNYDIDFISKKFPYMTFYCSADPKTENTNVVDLSKQNLIYLQNVIKKCKIFIGKGSGPFFLTCSKETKSMPKAVFGYKLEKFGTLWADDYPVDYFDGDNELVIEYLKTTINNLKIH